jgi:atypical dual specificity phosphatase
VRTMDSWWIDRPRVLGSSNPTNDDLAQLRREGFDVLVSLLREDEQATNYDVVGATGMGFRRHSLPVKDFNPPTVEQLMDFIGIMEELAEESKIIIHCQAGIGRTGTFAAAYYIAKGMPIEEAIEFVREARWHAIQTSEQEAVLEKFAMKYAARTARPSD